MWRSWLACAALAALALGVPMAGVAQAAPMSGQHKAVARPIVRHHHRRHRHQLSFNQQAATYVQSLEGIPYVYGGTSTAGFDCSGLTQYVYGRFGLHIQRTAEEQFVEFRRISRAQAVGGDLVFFHVSNDPDSYVYHVGVYEGGDSMVAATGFGGDVQWQSFDWAGDTVTFGTITH
jgi:cell wall-associated NlpC family hydrolase